MQYPFGFEAVRIWSYNLAQVPIWFEALACYLVITYNMVYLQGLQSKLEQYKVLQDFDSWYNSLSLYGSIGYDIFRDKLRIKQKGALKLAKIF